MGSHYHTFGILGMEVSQLVSNPKNIIESREYLEDYFKGMLELDYEIFVSECNFHNTPRYFLGNLLFSASSDEDESLMSFNRSSIDYKAYAMSEKLFDTYPNNFFESPQLIIISQYC